MLHYKNMFVMVGAFLSILLLMVARHHPPSRRKIKEIWHGRVYWESNTTMLRSSLNSGSEVTEQEVTEPEPRQEVLVPEQKVVSSWNPASQSWFEGLFPMGKQKIGTYGKGVASTSVVYEFVKYATPWISCGSATPLEFASAIPSRPVFVVDVVMVAYDIDVLEIRLYEHAPYVDLFIVVESTTTQRGAPKPLFFERYGNRFASIADRIVYKVVEGKRHDHDGLDERTDEWLNENVPRQQGMSMVREYRGSKPLVVLSGDVDEFWSREALESLTRGPVEGIASPSSMYTFFNGVYAQPHGPYQSRSGAIPLAWSLPQAKNPKHASTVLHKGIGFNMGSTFSPIAWMCKELSVSEGGGISWAHSDARTRVQHPWVDFEKYRVGIRPCCGNDRARPKRSTTDTSPIPRLLTDEPTRFPYLMGNATPCEASTLASGAYPDVCTPSKQLFGLCASNDNDNPIKSVMVPEPKPVENVPEVHKPMIAICAATHSKSTWRSIDDTALQKLLIPSIEKTISTSDRSTYKFHLYLAADHDDHFWLQNQNNVKTPDWLSVHIGFYDVPEHKIPFNPMMRAAYNDGAEYMVRINDDSEFMTSDWVSKAVAKLASYDPPNVGMVGPNCREGNTKIMTHDMVHRTHLDIFEHYYPDVFSAWWIDDWISKVYGPQRSTKMMDWTVKHHTHKHGTRYKVQGHEKQLLKGELEKGGEKIEKWLKKVQLHKAVDDAIINPESEQQPENSEPPHLKTNKYIGISAFIKNINPKLCSHAKILKGTSKLEPDVRICMPELPCVVYSFGIANNWLFDDMMLDHGCSVWSFDPSMKIGKHSRRPTHLFEPIGIGATSGTHKGASTLYGGKNHYMVMTLEDLMKKYGHTHIDIVRMDTETAEWDVLAQWNRDNTWSQFDQLLMEIHLMRPASNSYNSKALTDPEVSTYTNILQHIPFKLFHSAQNKDPSAMVNLYNGLTRVYEVGLIKTKPVNLKTKPSLIISGVARDVYAHQDSVLKTIREQQNHFNIIKIVVYENDSKDDTLKGLHTWQDKLRIPVDIINEKKIGGNRVERISRGRNAILVVLDKISSPPDFLLIMDLDSVNANLKGVQTCLDMEQPWGACCANQRGIYYDLWALRTFDDWCDCDVWNDAECAKTREAKFRHISTDNDPIEVKSCFGGAALYNYTRLKTLVKQGARYDSDTCEHVSFHKHLRKQDDQFKLFIQPKMLNDGEEKHVPLSVRTRLEIKKKPREKLTIERTRDAFKIIILTQRRHWSLKRLLNSLNAANYAGHNVHIEIRVDKHDSEDHRKTLETARAFKFEHGTVDVHENTHTRGLQYAWFDAWTPRSETERAIIIEDDLEVSPLWFTWLQQAWTTYGSRDDLGSISICKQPLRASDGRQIDKQVDAPFMYRMIGSWGFSPNARFWKPFIEWVRNVDLKNTDVYVPGCITSAYHKSNPDSWEQFYIWWCNKYSLYAMYVHPRDGALVAHWGEPGVHYSGQPKRNVNLIRQTEPALENFPAELVHYGWDFEPEKTSLEQIADHVDLAVKKKHVECKTITLTEERQNTVLLIENARLEFVNDNIILRVPSESFEHVQKTVNECKITGYVKIKPKIIVQKDDNAQCSDSTKDTILVDSEFWGNYYHTTTDHIVPWFVTSRTFEMTSPTVQWYGKDNYNRPTAPIEQNLLKFGTCLDLNIIPKVSVASGCYRKISIGYLYTFRPVTWPHVEAKDLRIIPKLKPWLQLAHEKLYQCYHTNKIRKKALDSPNDWLLVKRTNGDQERTIIFKPIEKAFSNVNIVKDTDIIEWDTVDKLIAIEGATFANQWLMPLNSTLVQIHVPRKQLDVEKIKIPVIWHTSLAMYLGNSVVDVVMRSPEINTDKLAALLSEAENISGNTRCVSQNLEMPLQCAPHQFK